MEAASQQEARSILPVEYRAKATIVQLNKFGMQEMDGLIRHHMAWPAPHTTGAGCYASPRGVLPQSDTGAVK